DRQRNRRDREEDTLHAKGQKTQRESHERSNSGSRQDLQGQRRAECLDQEHRGIDANAEERAGAEVHGAGIAAKDTRGDTEREELQDDVAGEEWILVTDDLRHDEGRGEKDCRSDPEGDSVALHDRLPNRPCGRTARTTSSIAKEIAGAQEAPNEVITIDSATPRMMAATSVPLMLPSPAMTTTQKVRPI